VRPTAFFELWGVSLDPTVDGAVIDMQTPFPHHFLQIAVAERVPKVPAYAEQNDLGFEMTPFERVLIVHEGNSSAFLNRGRAYHITSLFATQPFQALTQTPADVLRHIGSPFAPDKDKDATQPHTQAA
jgi:hypothetical protein